MSVQKNKKQKYECACVIQVKNNFSRIIIHKPKDWLIHFFWCKTYAMTIIKFKIFCIKVFISIKYIKKTCAIWQYQCTDNSIIWHPLHQKMHIEPWHLFIFNINILIFFMIWSSFFDFSPGNNTEKIWYGKILVYTF